jgi:hypothetical protein
MFSNRIHSRILTSYNTHSVYIHAAAMIKHTVESLGSRSRITDGSTSTETVHRFINRSRPIGSPGLSGRDQRDSSATDFNTDIIFTLAVTQ